MIRALILITAPVTLPAAWLVGKVRRRAVPPPPVEVEVYDPDPIAAVYNRWAAELRADVEQLRAELDDEAAVARWLGAER